MQSYSGNRSHCGLDSFGIIYIGSAPGTEDILYPEPVCYADYRSQVSGILNVIKRKDQIVPCSRFNACLCPWNFKQRNHVLRGLKQTGPFQLIRCHCLDTSCRNGLVILHPLIVGKHHGAAEFSQQFSHQFRPFGNKQIVFLAELLVLQALYKLYVIPAQHTFVFCSVKIVIF